MYKTFFLLCSAVLLFSAANGQRKMSREEYIELYKDVAIREMREYRIPASITLAQGILESGCGGSTLATEAKNHFGIKCHKEWTGERFYYDDDEKNECFRVYADADESYSDHSLFLTNRDRYKSLFTLKITDYKAWAHGLKSVGYATNPQYAHLLIKIIEEHDLDKYDRIGLNEAYIVEQQVVDATSMSTPFVPKTILPEYRKIETAPCGREVYENNGLKFVYAGENDSYYRIAQDFHIYSYQIYKYNETPKNHFLKVGEMVYLEKKKKKGVVAHYFVQQGELIPNIAQKTGITAKSLCSKNRIVPTAVLQPGTMLWLVKKKPGK